MDYHDILYTHSWSADDKPYWLWWNFSESHEMWYYFNCGYVIVVLYLPFSLSNPSIIVKSISITGMEHSEVPLNNDFVCFDYS